jgi:hypothetical protein
MESSPPREDGSPRGAGRASSLTDEAPVANDTLLPRAPLQARRSEAGPREIPPFSVLIRHSVSGAKRRLGSLRTPVPVQPYQPLARDRRARAQAARMLASVCPRCGWTKLRRSAPDLPATPEGKTPGLRPFPREAVYPAVRVPSPRGLPLERAGTCDSRKPPLQQSAPRYCVFEGQGGRREEPVSCRRQRCNESPDRCGRSSLRGQRSCWPPRYQPPAVRRRPVARVPPPLRRMRRRRRPVLAEAVLEGRAVAVARRWHRRPFGLCRRRQLQRR